MKRIEVSDEEYEELKKRAIPLMEPEDTVATGIRKLIRKTFEMDTGVEEKTVENVLEAIPEPYRYLAEEVVEEISSQMDVEYAFPGTEVWEEQSIRWVNFKKLNPRGRKAVLGGIDQRQFGCVIWVYDPNKREDVDFKLGKDYRIPEVKEPNEDSLILTPLTKEEVVKEPEYQELKKSLINAFWKAYNSL